MRYRLILLLIIVSQFLISSCAIFPYYSHYNVKADSYNNKSLTLKTPAGAYLASENVRWQIDWCCRNSWRFDKNLTLSNPLEICPMSDRNFIGIAISGGGSRAAIFSAAVLFELQRYGILQQVDVISSVSGGSFTAAYYALSSDEPDKGPPTIDGALRPRWEPLAVFTKLEKNFIAKWILSSFWLENILRYWFSYYDRTDLMAGVIADILYDTSWLKDKGLCFKDLNPQRPYLIINATNNTEGTTGSRLFWFTQEAFRNLGSDIADYPIAHAVMASAAFPAVFQSVTLRDYSRQETWFVQLIDGSTSDNLGISALDHIVKKQTNAETKKLVIVIDAHKANYGKDPRDPDPRSLLDYYVDTNVIDAYQTLIDELRHGKTDNLRCWLQENNGKLIHIKFDDLKERFPELYESVIAIKTNLMITKNEASCLKHAARILVSEKIEELYLDPWWKKQILYPPTEGYEIPPCRPKYPKALDSKSEPSDNLELLFSPATEMHNENNLVIKR